MNHDKYQSCITACLECSIQCEDCASACMRSPDRQELMKCIQLDRECAAICMAAVRIMSMASEHVMDICQVCAVFCGRCAEECEKHSHMEHCRRCAEYCRKCEKECQEMAAHSIY